MKSGTFRVQPDLLRKLPCYLCSLVTFKYSTYNVRSQDVLTLAVSLVLNELGQSRFMYYTANKWLTYFCVFLIVKMCCCFFCSQVSLEKDLISMRLPYWIKMYVTIFSSEPEKMKSMSQLAVLTRRWSPATMKLGPFQEVILESSSVEELKEKVCLRPAACLWNSYWSLPHNLYWWEAQRISYFIQKTWKL